MRPEADPSTRGIEVKVSHVEISMQALVLMYPSRQDPLCLQMTYSSSRQFRASAKNIGLRLELLNSQRKAQPIQKNWPRDKRATLNDRS